jgi:hypothetical protein
MVAQKGLFHRLSADAIGFSVSALCAVHCVVLPLALLFTTTGWLSYLEGAVVENTILLISVTVALASLVPSYLHHHRNLKALFFFGVGFLLIGLGRLEVNEVWEISTTTIGAALVASAHFINHLLCRSVRLQSSTSV